MLKHIGTHKEQKIIILFREVPEEPHMALVIYTARIPQTIMGAINKCLESEVGQQAKDFADALFRCVLADGRNALEVLHKEGYIKKVATKDILVTPNVKTRVRLDELNKIINEIATGKEAEERLAKQDSSLGFGNPEINNSSAVQEIAEIEPVTVKDTYGLLSDSDLAEMKRKEAISFRKNAESLLAEAAKLEAEADTLAPVVVAENTTPTINTNDEPETDAITTVEKEKV